MIASEENFGKYILNNFEFETNKITLTAPKLTQQQNTKNQSENTYFQIFCAVDRGSDPLFFEWLINEVKVKPSPDVNYKIENNKRFSILSIEKLRQKDSANYGCVVSNQFGSDSQNTLLTVKGLETLI